MSEAAAAAAAGLVASIYVSRGSGENNFIALFSLFRALKVKDDGCVIKLLRNARATAVLFIAPFTR